MAAFPLSADDRKLVADAVAAAEAGTDGEILTIVTQRSDEYRDTGLIWGALASLLVLASAAAWPWWVDAKIAFVTGGWGEEPSVALRYLTLSLCAAAVFGIVLLLFRSYRVRVALTLKSVKAARVRGRAIRYFKVGAEKRTAARVGVLLYLSLDERLAEIVADAAIHAKVPPEAWGDAMVALIDAVRAGRPAQGLAGAIRQIGAIVGQHFPKTEADANELPDRLIEL